LTAIVRYR